MDATIVWYTFIPKDALPLEEQPEIIKSISKIQFD